MPSKQAILAQPAAAELRRNATSASPAGRRRIPSPRALDVAELKKRLWSAADILRGAIDSSDYKTYIFGLLWRKLQKPKRERTEVKATMHRHLAGLEYGEQLASSPDSAGYGVE